MTSPNCIELFAGAGGASLGLHCAGFRALAHIEWDKDACATLRAAVAAGLLDGDVVEGDVREVDWSRWPSPDLLWASPPCQDWSTAGKREGAQGSRNGWPWTWDVVDHIKPTWFLAENVPGMLMHAGGADACRGNPEGCPACYTAEVLMPDLRRRFAFAGYYVIDAADHGVPQHRNRVYFWGGPRPLPCPTPTHADPATVGQGGLFGPRMLPWVTVREALGLIVAGIATAHGPGEPVAERQVVDLSDRLARTVPADMGGSIRGGNMVVLDPRHPPATLDAPAPSLRSGGDGHSAPPMWLDVDRGAGMSERHGERAMSSVDDPAPAVRARSKGAPPLTLTWLEDKDGRLAQSLDEPAPTLRAGGATDASGKLGGGSPHYIASRAGTEPARLDRPAPTVTQQEVKGTRASAKNPTFNGGPDRARDALFLATGRRRLTPEECATLQSFPPDWPFQGTKTAIYRQVGNACAWPVVAALGRQVLA